MIIAVVGPTGVGKTKLSIELAKKYKGIIINVDATQIYKGLDIGSAKVTEEEKSGIKHYLLDIKNPDEDYSVADFQKDARKIIEDNKDKNIILVGGTGLYLKALLYDYHFQKFKSVDYSKFSNEELLEMCKEIDPNVDIHINNRVRLENYLKREGKCEKSSQLLYDVKFIGLTTDRNILYNKINKRVDEMFKLGLVDEVKDLYNKYPDSKILKRAIGYKEVIAYLKGELSLEEAKDLIKKNSRHYAKRQYTWFNNQMPIKWFQTNYDNFAKTLEEIINYLT